MTFRDPLAPIAPYAAGVYEIDSRIYHSDPCPKPSLSSSGVNTLLESTPAHFRAEHPRLSTFPDSVEKPTKEQTLGTLVHRLLLGRGEEIHIVRGFTDWRKDAAKAERDAARAKGFVASLEHELAKAQTIADYAAAAIEKSEWSRAWAAGASEQTMIWQRPTDHGDIYCRALVDRLNRNAGVLFDLKTTSRVMSDSGLASKFADGDDVQAAFYLEGFEVLVPDLAGRTNWVWVSVETDPPFGVRFAEFPEHWRSLAWQRIDHAANVFAQSLAADDWPCWETTARLRIPPWREKQWVEATLTS